MVCPSRCFQTRGRGASFKLSELLGKYQSSSVILCLRVSVPHNVGVEALSSTIKMKGSLKNKEKDLRKTMVAQDIGRDGSGVS